MILAQNILLVLTLFSFSSSFSATANKLCNENLQLEFEEFQDEDRIIKHNNNSRPYKIFFHKDKWYTKYVYHKTTYKRNYIIETLHFEVEEGLPTILNESVLTASSNNPEVLMQKLKEYGMIFFPAENFDHIFLPLVALANQAFEKRRGWGRSFSIKNFNVALDNLENSTYIIVKDLMGNILGGIRNIAIHKSDRSLPMENYLDIDLPRLGLIRDKNTKKYWQNEIGTYVVDHKLDLHVRKKVTLELWTQLIKHLTEHQNFSEFLHKQAFFTYADRRSLRLYKPVGFQLLRVYKYKGEWKIYIHHSENQIPPITIKTDDGEKKWWPIVFLPNWLDELKGNFKPEELKGTELERIINHHSLLTDKHIGNYQFDALFSYFLQDLFSDNENDVVQTLQAISDLLKPYIEYHDQLYNKELVKSKKTSEEMEWLRENSDKILGNLTKYIAEKLYDLKGVPHTYLTKLIGQIMGLEKNHMNFFDVDQFVRECFWPAVMLDSMSSQVHLFKALNQYNEKSPKQWLKALKAPRDSTKIKERAYGIIEDPDKADEIIESLRKTIFEKVKLDDPDKDYYLDYSNEPFPWSNVVSQFSNLKYQAPMIFRSLFILAAEKQRKINRTQQLNLF